MFASIYYPFDSALKPRIERGAFYRPDHIFGRQSAKNTSSLKNEQSGNDDVNYTPPFNLKRLSDRQFQIDLLVAGYQESDIQLSVEGKTLVVQGNPLADKSQAIESTDLKPTFLRQEWGVLPFKRFFSLEEHIQVESAKLSQGILSIFLTREIPQEEKPKIIPIES